MVTCLFIKDGRYQLVEMEPHVRLIFRGPDAHLFQQVNQPLLRFALTVAYLRKEFLVSSRGNVDAACRAARNRDRSFASGNDCLCRRSSIKTPTFARRRWL